MSHSGQFVSFSIAPSDAPAAVKAWADYVCDGVNDEVEIQAAHDALPATGGTVFSNAGTLNIQTNPVLVTKPGFKFVGAGKNGTKINSSLNVPAINIAMTPFGANSYYTLSDFWMNLTGNGGGIKLGHGISNCGEIERLRFTGGASPAVWAIDAQGSNLIKIDSIYMDIECSGIIWQTVPGADPEANWGDSVLSHIWIALDTNRTGIKLVGPNNLTSRINNILLEQVEIGGKGPTDTCVGVQVRNSSRITLNHVDLENLQTGILHEAGQDGGAGNHANAFCHVFCLNCGDDYAEVGTPTHMTVVGGDGEFETNQQLSGIPVTA